MILEEHGRELQIVEGIEHITPLATISRRDNIIVILIHRPVTFAELYTINCKMSEVIIDYCSPEKTISRCLL